MSQVVIKNPATERNDLTRVPAQELETRVTERLVAFLKSDAEVFDGLGLSEERPAVANRLVKAAKQLAARLGSMSSQDLRDLLASFIWRVTIQESQIGINIRQRELHLLLSGRPKVSPTGVPLENQVPPSDLISLTVEAKRKRCGGEVHLIVPPSASASHAQPKLPLIKALARAHGWYENVIKGKAFDMRSLAREAGLTERYVGKVFRCAFLAPDIVEAILAGRQPQELNFDKLCQNVPLNWAEQREQLGFDPANTRRPQMLLQ